MSLFSRRRTTLAPAPAGAPETPVQAFWRWWALGAADQLARATGSQSQGHLSDRMTDQVRGLHPGLRWEVGPGDRAAHAFTVTGSGAALRGLTQRWRDAAPAEDAQWQFEPAGRRRRDLDVASVPVDGHVLALASATVSTELDEARQVFDVVVHHPGFAGLPDAGRRRFALLALSWTLGEDDVERWVGAVDTEVHDGRGAEPLNALAAAVDDAARAVEPRWVRHSGTADGHRAEVTVRRPLCWIDHPRFDQHHVVTLPFDDEQQPDGRPTGPALRRLGDLQDGLVQLVEDRAVLVALETGGGRRTLHLYADGEDVAVAERVTGWVRDTAGASHGVSPDPGWRAVRGL